jgi:ribosomal protein S27AE
MNLIETAKKQEQGKPMHPEIRKMYEEYFDKCFAMFAKDHEKVFEQIQQEQNFCPRCGKRTSDLAAIHTCTPPKQAQEKNT